MNNETKRALYLHDRGKLYESQGLEKRRKKMIEENHARAELSNECNRPLDVKERIELLKIINAAKPGNPLGIRVSHQLSQVQHWQDMERERLRESFKSPANRLREIADIVDDYGIE